MGGRLSEGESCGGYTCPHCALHSAAALEDVHPAINVTCENCGEDAVVTVMTVDEYVRYHETLRAARALADEAERTRSWLTSVQPIQLDNLQRAIDAFRATDTKEGSE